jgi:hypothetical protein
MIYIVILWVTSVVIGFMVGQEYCGRLAKRRYWQRQAEWTLPQKSAALDIWWNS